MRFTKSIAGFVIASALVSGLVCAAEHAPAAAPATPAPAAAAPAPAATPAAAPTAAPATTPTTTAVPAPTAAPAPAAAPPTAPASTNALLVEQCIADSQDEEGATPEIVKIYCECMSAKMGPGEKQSITAWETEHVKEANACTRKAGWK